jgi:hypothetical protein
VAVLFGLLQVWCDRMVFEEATHLLVDGSSWCLEVADSALPTQTWAKRAPSGSRRAAFGMMVLLPRGARGASEGMGGAVLSAGLLQRVDEDFVG